MKDVTKLLEEMVERGASDLHLSVGTPPQLRIDGVLFKLEYETLSPEDTRALAYSMLDEQKIKRFEREKGLDTSFGITGLGRFRVNVFYGRGSVACAIRHLPWEIPSMEELGVPPIMSEFCERLAGLVLVSGPTGSGKSTTIASMIDYVNTTKHVHIVSIEDPVEYLHNHKQGIVNQREIGDDAVSFSEGVRHVLRQDPDVILIGEIRDLETVRTALTLAETGHLVFTTVHTNEAPQAISRVVDIFPPYEQQGVRIQLSLCLLGVLVQRLVAREGGHGRAMASEVLVATPAVRNLIRENNLQQLRTSIETGAQDGMHSLNDSLLMLERAGVITLETALNTTNDLKGLMREIRRTNPQWAAEFAQ